MPRLSIVGVSFLNARPLQAGLETGLPAAFPYSFQVAEPARCAQLLAQGEAQVGLVPVAALARQPSLRAYPYLGVAAQHEVRSVLLLSKVPLQEVRRLAAHRASVTSVTLAQLILAVVYGARPEVVPASPPVEAMLARADAAVIIGDPALACNGLAGVERWDLAGEWRRWRGLPFVFALWGLAPAADAAVCQLLEASWAFAQANWHQLVPQWAKAHGTSPEQVEEYLSRCLRFPLGEEERQAVEEFLLLSHEFRLLPARGEVWWYA